MAYEKVADKGSGSYFRWDVVGKVFEGRFVGLGTGSYEGRTTYHAKFTTDAGEIRVDTPTVLRRRLDPTADADVRINPGDQCRITFTGTKKGKQPVPMKMFDIEVDRGGAAPAGGGDVEEAYALVVAAKGEAAAKAIRNAVENVAKNDPAKQADLLRKAVGA